MKRMLFTLTLVSLLFGCGPQNLKQNTGSLVEARRGFVTKLVAGRTTREAVAEPPAGVLRIVEDASPAGKMPAYLSPAAQDGAKRPAIIWITGGDCNSIGDVWSPAPPSDDQTARAFRDAGIIMMYPSLRGGNQSPGEKQGFLGEVDDILAAADYLAKQDFVDPSRIYLGGHSTGGTLALLAAECSPRFRAVFSFGPVADVSCYPTEFLPFDTSSQREVELRSPGYWLHCVQSPVFVLEGNAGNVTNIADLRRMMRSSTNPRLHFHPVPGTDHFSTLAPVTRLIAGKILRDEEPECSIAISDAELGAMSTR